MYFFAFSSFCTVFIYWLLSNFRWIKLIISLAMSTLVGSTDYIPTRQSTCVSVLFGGLKSTAVSEVRCGWNEDLVSRGRGRRRCDGIYNMTWGVGVTYHGQCRVAIIPLRWATVGVEFNLAVPYGILAVSAPGPVIYHTRAILPPMI